VHVGWRPDSATAYALRWTAQQPSDELAALIGMARADSRAAFEAALETWRAPEQNVVYADSEGTIAYYLAGFVPVRRSGDGSRPQPGWTAAGSWDRFLATEELPRAVNPASGFIVTANTRIVGDAFPVPIRADYDLPYRAERIWEMVRRDTAATAALVARQQVDVVNVFLRRLAPTAAVAAEAAGQAALGERLRHWDGALAAERTEPTLIWSWYRELQALTFDDESPDFRPTAPLHHWPWRGRARGSTTDVRPSTKICRRWHAARCSTCWPVVTRDRGVTCTPLPQRTRWARFRCSAGSPASTWGRCAWAAVTKP
jgi:acyl-homoserine lactone acylase PvdQ